MNKTDEDKLLLKQVIQAVVADYHSTELTEIVAALPTFEFGQYEGTGNEGAFCNRFDLGNWFYEAMLINDIDVVDELNGMISIRCDEEKEAHIEDEAMRQMREAQLS